MIDVQKLAELARLSVPLDEQAVVEKDMEKIIEFVDIVQSRTAATVPEAKSEVNIMRDDVVMPLVPEHDLVQAAPSHQEGFVKVPKIIGE